MPQVAIPFIATTLGTSTFVAGAIYYVGTTVLTAAALSALAPKPGAGAASGQLVNVRDAIGPQEYVYGQVRKGGTIVFAETTGANNKFLHLVIALAGHPVEEVGDIYINDEIVTISSNFVTGARWDSKVRIKKYDGTQTAVDPDLLAETSWPATAVGTGIAYIYARLEYDQNVFSGGLPTITAVVKGKKVENTSGVAQTYPASANAALVIRDYLKSAYGLNDTGLNETYFATAANDCNDDIPLAAGGTQKRYTIDGVVNADQAIGDVLQNMLTACNGTLYYSGGEWRLRVGVYEPSIMSFTLDDIRSDITLPTRVSRRDNFNRVVGTFSDASGDWIEADYPPVVSAQFLAEDANIENSLDLPLTYVTNGSRAQRVAKQVLFRSREQMTFSADFSLKAMDVEVGDIVDLTITEYGWSAKEFEVVNWRMTIDAERGAQVSMTLRETSQAAFDWDAEESALAANNTTLLPYYEAVAVGISLATEAIILSEKLINRLDITVSSTSPEQVAFAEVEFKKSSDSTWIKVGIGELGLFNVFDLERADYDVRARSINPFGVRGAWATVSEFNVDATGGAPADVDGFSFEVVGNQLNLSWEPVPDLDLSFYRVRHSISQTGASWAAATTAIDKVARPGVSASLPLRSGSYLIRAYDKSLVPSDNYTTVVVPVDYLPSYTTTTTQTEDPSFTGSKTGVSVVSSALRLTSPITAGDSGTYDFSTYIDTTSARLVWARIEAAVTRQNDAAGLFDDLPGLFDALAGLFDDLGNQQFDDHNVLFYISTTNDDPAGTPTWSAYQLFRAGNFYGRAFRFRVVLTTHTDEISPNITALDAIVEY